MFANRYFPERYFADRYWGTSSPSGVYVNSPAEGATALVVPGFRERRAPLVMRTGVMLGIHEDS